MSTPCCCALLVDDTKHDTHTHEATSTGYLHNRQNDNPSNRRLGQHIGESLFATRFVINFVKHSGSGIGL